MRRFECGQCGADAKIVDGIGRCSCGAEDRGFGWAQCGQGGSVKRFTLPKDIRISGLTQYPKWDWVWVMGRRVAC